MSDNVSIFAEKFHAMKPNLLTKACWVLFFIFSLFSSSLQAQHFEWAKGYASGQEGNQIVGSVTDSEGNLYILGSFRNDASWDGGSHLLPMAPYGLISLAPM